MLAKKNVSSNQVLWLIPVVPAHIKLKQEDCHEFKAILSYPMSLKPACTNIKTLSQKTSLQNFIWTKRNERLQSFRPSVRGCTKYFISPELMATVMLRSEVKLSLEEYRNGCLTGTGKYPDRKLSKVKLCSGKRRVSPGRHWRKTIDQNTVPRNCYVSEQLL